MKTKWSYQESFEKSVKKALDNGFEVVRGAPNLLLLDIDDAASMARFNTFRPMLDHNFGIVKEEIWHSKESGDHCHIVVTLREELTAAQRIALQAVLGSDPKRELLAVLLMTRGIDEPSLLFKPEHAVGFTDMLS